MTPLPLENGRLWGVVMNDIPRTCRFLDAQTVSWTRREAIAKWMKRWRLSLARRGWRNLRRAGEVKCCRIIISLEEAGP